MRLKVEPDVVALGPGDVTDLLVRVHNDGEDTCTPHLQVRGVDPDDVLLPDEVVAVPAGSVMTAIVRVRAAADAIPGDRRIAVAVEDLEGSQSTVSATTVLRIGARPDVAVEVDPVATAGRRGAKASTVLRNRSDRRLQIELEGRGDGVLVSFRPSRVTLDPGETKRVRTRMRRAQRSWFGEIRHGAVVTARGVGLPASTTATFTQKPSVPRPAVRGVAALTALAVWVAATVVVFNRINAEPEAGPDTGVAAGPAAPGPGRTSATGMFEDDAEEGIRLPVVIQGTVEGPRDPSGTTLTAERIGFGDQGTTTGFTKVVALTEVNLPRGNVLDVVRTTTDERGRFRIASGLVEDAFYRVTAVRAGFEVGSFIVSTSADQPEVTLAIALEPATGSLAGLVTDTTGAPVGEAEVLVTDGSAEYTAVTPSEGDEAGRWVLEGLATPATYQVVVSRRGFAAQTLIVDLDGGQQRTGVDAELSADLGTIVGRVVDANPDPDQPGVAQGVGALTVTLAGPEARETRTLTVAGDLRGTFDLPGLPFGDYTVTFSGDGWVTRQAEVTVDRGLVRLDASVNRSTGVVQGWVWQTATGPDAFQGACRYPRVEQRDGGPDSAAADPRPRPCGGVSVSITSDDGDLFATASATDTGFFQIGGVPAGEYTLTLSRPGYVSDVRSIVVQPGGTFRLNPDRTAAVLDVTEAEPFTDFIPLELAAPAPVCIGTVVVNLVDVFSGGAAPDTDASGTDLITVSGAGECEPQPTATRIGTTGAYRLDNVPLGPRTITVGDESDLAWPYAETDVNVQVSAQEFAAVTAPLQPRPRELVLPAGAIELVGPLAAQRQVIVEVLDKDDEVVAVTAAALTLGGAAGSSNAAPLTFGPLPPDSGYRIRAVGPDPSVFPGFEATVSAPFAIPLGAPPFELEVSEEPLPVSVIARTRLTGTVWGFVASPLALGRIGGAEISGPGGTLATSAEGTGLFSFDVDSGTLARDSLTISATGYVDRSFPPSARDVVAITEPLRRVGDDFFVLYGDPNRAAGDLGLDAEARAVEVPVRLLGGVGVTRTLTATLEEGVVPFAPGSGPIALDTVTSDPLPLTVVAGEFVDGTLEFEDVPVGTYRLRITGTDLVERVFENIEIPPAASDTPGAHVVPGVAADRSVQATTSLSLTVLGAPTNVALDGATVKFPAGTLLEGADGSDPDAANTGTDGTVSVTAKAGTYGTSGTTFGALSVSKAAYSTDPAVEIDLRNPDPAGDPITETVTLQPAPRRDVSGSILLTVIGSAAIERASLTAELFPLDGDTRGTPLDAVTFDSGEAFTIPSVPVGSYDLDISGEGIALRTVRIEVLVGSGTFTITPAIAVRATTTVTGIVGDGLGDGKPETFVGLGGRTITFLDGGVDEDGDPATVEVETADSGDVGSFTAVITAGTYAEGDARVEARDGYPVIEFGGGFTGLSTDVGTLLAVPTLDAGTFRLTGTIVSDSESTVTSIVATDEAGSAAQRVAVLDSGASPGSYLLEGLGSGKVWRIEFKKGTEVLATRWVKVDAVADSGTQVMNQDVRSGSFAVLRVEIAGPTDAPLELSTCSQVKVQLREDSAFPSIASDGLLEKSGEFADAVCAVEFEVLVKRTDSRVDSSLPDDRFFVEVVETPDGYVAPAERRVHDAGFFDVTTVVANTEQIELSTKPVDVQITVTNTGTAVTDATVVASRDSSTISLTADSGTNVYSAALPPHVGGDPWTITITRSGNATRTIAQEVAPSTAKLALAQVLPALVVTLNALSADIFDEPQDVTVTIADPGGEGGPEEFVLPEGLMVSLATTNTGAVLEGCSVTLDDDTDPKESHSVTIEGCRIKEVPGDVELTATVSFLSPRASMPVTVAVVAPGAPSIDAITTTDTTAVVSWKAPTSLGGSPLTGYVLQQRGKSDPEGDWAASVPQPNGSDRSVTVTDLDPGTTYEFRVAAVNAAGTGAFSSPGEATTSGGLG